ncbi:uncharacterized protein LACBIDRAFT_330644 [Laccaria bicolor S238N-H82]|uniref:Predicted protein n=1 Tax=Laccaria bicolor (strain S238N-H82 / ATCC MYA-4686) TaxID=486041 RepID=B0DM04_LACBS|nr:uncharacterized protein LACBIDRAFT_330644 [Laccaria bicolor S238N-H82]EDR04386.1 predicted protein [Laccaria bicolor S238N-H82]|eukprot:XP_001884905.1 predicted protein [Laccaria bicolor S238N-H82]
MRCSVDEFKAIYNALPENSAICPVFSHLLERYDLDEAEKTTSTFLHRQWDSLCTQLKKKKVIETVSGFESLFAWFAELVKLEEVHSSYHPVSAFETLFIEIHYCTGLSSTGGPHLTPHDFKQFQGDFALYFADWVSLDKEQVPATSCWRVKETVPLCLGAREDICYLLTSLLLLFTIEVGDEHPSETMPQEWDFPLTLLPHTQSAANSHGLVYDLMGLALTQSFYCSAFYLLCGGAVAQDLFFQVRTAALAKKFNLRFSTNNLDRLFSTTYHSDQFVELESNKRTWLLNPLRSQTLEYVSRDAPADITEESLSPEPKQGVISQPGSPTTPPSPLSSLPDSEFELNCQCGIIGNGNILYRHEHGVAIQCDQCHDWSHIACQLVLGSPVFCLFDLDILHYEWYLNLFIRAGRGTLARCEQFWYPVRLIQAVQHSWRVHWWRENQFLDKDEPAAGGFSVVNTKDIVDSLWNDQLARRAIRLGKWKHAWDIETSEDILADPSKIPYMIPAGIRAIPGIPEESNLAEGPAKLIKPFRRNFDGIQIPPEWFQESPGRNDPGMRRNGIPDAQIECRRLPTLDLGVINKQLPLSQPPPSSTTPTHLATPPRHQRPPRRTQRRRPSSFHHDPNTTPRPRHGNDAPTPRHQPQRRTTQVVVRRHSLLTPGTRRGTTTSTHDHDHHAHRRRHASPRQRRATPTNDTPTTTPPPRQRATTASTDAHVNGRRRYQQTTSDHRHVNGPPPRQQTTTTKPTDDDNANGRQRQQTTTPTDDDDNAANRRQRQRTTSTLPMDGHVNDDERVPLHHNLNLYNCSKKKLA